MKNNLKVVFISLKGLGDTFHLIPAIRILHEHIKNASITILVPDKTCAEIFKHCPYVTPVIIKYRQGLIKNLISIIQTLFKIRRERFKISITSFPSNRIWYNLMAFFLKADRRITHDYPCGGLKTLSFLQNCKISALPAKHEIEHNVDLLSCLGINSSIADSQLAPWISNSEENAADLFFTTNGLIPGKDLVIGLHPSINSNKIYKNWDPVNIKIFAELSDWLQTEKKAKVIIFGGPDETNIVLQITKYMSTKAIITSQPDINIIAAILKRCFFLINTDSGLGHVAAAVGIPVITIFGPANPDMSRPYGIRNTILKNELDCAPCYDYPYKSRKPRLKCNNQPCLKEINLNKLKECINLHMNRSKNEQSQFT